jgi:hypothetical protein
VLLTEYPLAELLTLGDGDDGGDGETDQEAWASRVYPTWLAAT